MNGCVITANIGNNILIKSFKMDHYLDIKDICRYVRRMVADGEFNRYSKLSIDDDINLWNLAGQELEEDYNYELCCAEYYSENFCVYSKRVIDVFDLLDFHQEVKLYYTGVAQ